MSTPGGIFARPINALNKKLLALRDTPDVKTSAPVLDELYELSGDALAKKSLSGLLAAAETLKLAYGALSLRSREDLSWRALVSGVIEQKEYQAAEYFLESGKNLLKRLPGNRPRIFKTLRTAAEESGAKEQFFLCARVFDLLVGFMPRLKNQDTPTLEEFFRCLRALGTIAIKTDEQPLFREICVVLAKNFSAGEHEKYWDKLFISWLTTLSPPKTAENFNNWLKPFKVYAAQRTNANIGFYAELFAAAGKYPEQDAASRQIVLKLLRQTARAGRPLEIILAMRSAALSFRKNVALLGWRRAAYIYQPLFLYGFHLTVRRRAFCGAVLEELVKGFYHITALSDELLPAWRCYFGQKAKSAGSKRRVDAFFDILQTTCPDTQRN